MLLVGLLVCCCINGDWGVGVFVVEGGRELIVVCIFGVNLLLCWLLRSWLGFWVLNDIDLFEVIECVLGFCGIKLFYWCRVRGVLV